MKRPTKRPKSSPKPTPEPSLQPIPAPLRLPGIVIDQKPVLNWVGSKQKLLPTITGPAIAGLESAHVYVEPFFGGGSLFWWLAGRGYLDNKRVILNDSLSEVTEILGLLARIDSIRLVEKVIAPLQSLFNNYNASNADFREKLYYSVRGLQRDRLTWGDPMFPNPTREQSVVRTIFLNRTCYRNLWRTNKNGENNCPHGDRKQIEFDSNELLTAQVLLKRLNLTIYSADYTEVINSLKSSPHRAFVYFDPPYHGTHSYGQEFTEADQIMLAKLAEECAEVRGWTVLLSNSSNPWIKGIYSEHAPNLTQLDIEVIHSMSAGKREAKTSELLVGSKNLFALKRASSKKPLWPLASGKLRKQLEIPGL